MADKFDEVGKVLTSIFNAVKAGKMLRQLEDELLKVIDESTKRAKEIEELQIPEEPLLEKLKQDAFELRDSGPQLKVWLQVFNQEVVSFENSLKLCIRDGAIPTSSVCQFAADVRRMNDKTTAFIKAFLAFIGHLDSAQSNAMKVTDSLNLKAKKLQEEASSKEKWGLVKVGIAGVGLAALGFFTGGAGWAAAGACIGSAVGSTVVSVTDFLDVKNSRGLATTFAEAANQLNTIAKDLKIYSEKAVKIELDAQSIEGFELALNFYKETEDKDEKMAEMQKQMAEKEKEVAEQQKTIAELKRKMAEMKTRKA